MLLKIVLDDASGLTAILHGLGDGLSAALANAMSDATQSLRDYIVADKLSGGPLKPRSGALRRSITAQVNARGNQTIGIVGTNVKYARIQEFGGVIRARRAANLTIPLASILDSSGEVRFTAREVIQSPAIGGFTRTFFRGHILFGVARNGVLTPLFKLQPEVELPARSFFGSALDERTADILAAFGERIAEVL
jgi:phage gpG-like protein